MRYGDEARAIFVSVDPERDTVPWLAEFVQFMPAGFTAATGTPDEIRATADDWGVRYAQGRRGSRPRRLLACRTPPTSS